MSEQSSGQNQASGKGRNSIIVVGCIIIITLIAVIVLLLRSGPETEEPKRNVVVNQSNVESVVDEMIDEPYVPPGYYSTAMTTIWHFQTGDAVSEDAYVANRAENTNDIYFDVFLAENEEEPIFQSPIIPRGSELDNISLDRALDAGTYESVMVYHLVDEDQKTISTLRIAFTIIVEA